MLPKLDCVSVPSKGSDSVVQRPKLASTPIAKLRPKRSADSETAEHVVEMRTSPTSDASERPEQGYGGLFSNRIWENRVKCCSVRTFH